MNISDLVTQYVTFRRTLGERCLTQEETLRSFCRAVGLKKPVRQIRAKAVTTFLNGTGPITGTWHSKHSTLKGFFRFAISRGYLDKAPLPTELPKRPPIATPYIYSRAEIRRLLEAIPARYDPRSCIEPATLRAILLLLYGAGLRLGEVLRLSVADADLSNRVLTIRDSKFFKSRLVPIGSQLADVLSDYALWRMATHPSADEGNHFFVNRQAKAVHKRTFEGVFQRLREHVGIRRTDAGRQQPRLHDLRHAFAVHRLTSWYRQGADVQRLVYHLSVYLGHVRLEHTQVYLTMTPELLQQAGMVFERYVCGEGDHA
ncbi:MAG: integrase [Planctomycetes bacterium]|nr:integrase [Planctomycetota bacterium]